MLFDTHCHLNFKAFDGQVDKIIERAKDQEVNYIVIPGTDYETSKKALTIAQNFNNVYAACAIHPHHIFEMMERKDEYMVNERLKQIELLLKEEKVIAVGEAGLDRHMYKKTKYQDYKVEEEFVELQKDFLEKQILLAIKHKKSLILHNREAKNDLLPLLSSIFDKSLEYKTVFHCCEADTELFEFAKTHKFFLGVDGDVAFSKEKQEFIKLVPLDMLVLETDSPYLSPERKFPNEPKNISLIAQTVANIKKEPLDKVERQTTENALKLFSLG
jgi:TatD DNase family protein